MAPRTLTIRQHLKELLLQGDFSTRELAGHVQCAERLVEDHLQHIIRSLERKAGEKFILIEPICLDCGFRFRQRTRINKPSRCPHCRSEAVTPPRFTIRATTNPQKFRTSS